MMKLEVRRRMHALPGDLWSQEDFTKTVWSYDTYYNPITHKSVASAKSDKHIPKGYVGGLLTCHTGVGHQVTLETFGLFLADTGVTFADIEAAVL